ncbi:MAG TPA: GNAT family N-acetyltransferase [Solirubrobacteraceae bacterium]|nr:GNAT family N-acetyltransferase [Solirubrobacteraceae bacterium]
MPADRALYLRGIDTLLASWEAIAAGSQGAVVVRAAGVAVAVFPSEPERTIYNNAVLERDLPSAARADALDAMEATYRSGSVGRYAVWVHESDEAMRSDVEARGYTIDISTRAMGMALREVRVPRPQLELAPPKWTSYVRHLEAVGVPPGTLAGVDPSAFQLLIASVEGQHVASAIAFDRDGDRGIFNVSTVESHRRGGLGTALTALLVHDARARGCATASLQATAMAERLYAAIGFRDLGRIIEYVP